ncbi:MAG TPA: GGDEF domain-containing protein [Jatrophihabitans sp.]|nr:GGDEF domain-containing protein [Jatrophihabitans sp.]
MSVTVTGQHPARRVGDHRPRVADLVRAQVTRFGQAWDPVSGGRWISAASGLVVTLTLPLLDRSDWRSPAGYTAVGTLVLSLVYLLVPWSRLPQRCTLLFPLIGWAALIVLAHGTHGIGAYYSSLYFLWFAYIGLTQPSGTSLCLAPIAASTFVIAWGGLTEPLLARLLIAVSIWVLLAELLASLVQRQRQLTKELRRLAHVDPLTNLANRRGLDLRLADIHAGDTVVICDIDHFKRLNDTQGHAAGDRVLVEFGMVLHSCLREQDFAARYGGEEFALLLPATGIQQAAATLARLRHCWAILQPGVTFSSGIARFGPDDSAPDVLLVADQALYAAKAAGRNRDHSADGRVDGGRVQPTGANVFA